MIEHTYTEQEWIAKREQDKVDFLKKSPSLLKKFVAKLTRRDDAVAAAAQAEEEVRTAAALQKRLNTLVDLKGQAEARLALIESYSSKLNAGILGWKSTLRENICEPGPLAESKRIHAAQNIALLQIEQQEIPARILELKKHVADLAKEATSLEKEGAK